MKPILTTIALLACAGSVHAQLYLANSNLWVTAQHRARVEYRANNFTFDRSVGADEDWFLLNRLRLGIGAKPVEALKVYGELQDAREIGSRRFVAGANPNLEEDTLDWRQGWFELANYKQFPLGLKLGRQELSYGDERLIGAFDWNNVGRVFDAVKLRWQPADYPGWIDFLAANVVAVDDNSFDDRADWADDFFGLYGRSEAMDKHALEAYALYRDKTDAVFLGAKRQIYTLGARLETKPAMKPWDYFVEVAGQFGHVQTPGGQFGETSPAWADHRAFAGVIGVGYTFQHEWKPRVGLEYNYATGDEDPTDGKNETFDNLYPTNHKFYGYIDLFAWKNLHNPRATVSIAPHKTVKVQLDGHLFWLAEERDAWYRANGVAIRRDATGGSGSFVGSEVDLTVWYNPHPRVRVLAGYSRFFTGDFVKDTGTGSDADFLYTQVTFSL
jgi:hypothetical protein